jgi:hypothetical protein
MTTDDELAAFFDGRTIGYRDWGQWTWRGSEYDSGWNGVLWTCSDCGEVWYTPDRYPSGTTDE